MADTRSKHVGDRERLAVKTAMKTEGFTTRSLAYELRLHYAHLAGMLGGSKPMAYHYLPAIKFLLLASQQNRMRAERLRFKGYPNEREVK